jgi:hypothetical protein
MKLLRSALAGLFCCLLALPAFSAGTIFGLPLSQQFTENGEPMSGGSLYIYEAGTSTPATAYESFSLTAGTELPHPMTLDSSGRIPEFWLADGSYRVRLTDVAGNEIFDISSTTALGASSGGAGSGDSVSDESIFQTGDIFWQPVNSSRSGWVRANARTIGSSASGATERANADTEDLFLFLWNNFDNTLCAVSGGRGGSAAADWAANKTITTLDMRGRLAYGMDTMGNSAASIVAGATTAGGAFGQEELAISQANLPNVNFTEALTVDAHTHTGPSHTHTGPSHTHTGPSHSHTGPSHSHTSGSYAVTDTSISNGTTVIRGSAVSRNEGGGGSYTTASAATSVTIALANGAVGGTSDLSGTGSTSADGTGATGASGTANTGADGTGNTGAASASSISGTVNSGGSGTAFDTLPPGRAGAWYLKL